MLLTLFLPATIPTAVAAAIPAAVATAIPAAVAATIPAAVPATVAATVAATIPATGLTSARISTPRVTVTGVSGITRAVRRRRNDRSYAAVDAAHVAAQQHEDNERTRAEKGRQCCVLDQVLRFGRSRPLLQRRHSGEGAPVGLSQGHPAEASTAQTFPGEALVRCAFPEQFVDTRSPLPAAGRQSYPSANNNLILV
jgi:hypothetical protein